MPGFTRFSSALVPVAAGRRRAPGIAIAYLVQGAGGGGSQGTSSVNWGAGAGAGIARAGTFSASPGAVYTIRIGAGGTMSVNGSASFFTLTSNVVATGGQGPSSVQRDGGRNDDYLGGQGPWVSTNAGGGAGSGGPGGIAGGAASENNGGPGYIWTAGDGVQRGGGGGAGTNSPGGAGGGGNGSIPSNGAPGTVNTGSGGGGCGTSAAGGQGGSGVVIVRYPSTEANLSSIGGGLTFSWSSAGGVKTYTFTAGSGNINW
jgi:hypothetical protein